MKAIRRSPITRATAWLLTMALVLPALSLSYRPAYAQTMQALKVIVVDFVNAKSKTTDSLAASATDAVAVELSNAAQGRFDPFPARDVRAAAVTVGLKVPSSAGQRLSFGLPDWLRIARELKADALVQGEIIATPPVKGKPVTAALSVTVMDVASQEIINGGQAKETVKLRPGETADPEELLNKAVENAALSAVRQIVERQLVAPTVLNVNDQTVILNRGIRDGLREGMSMVILREDEKGAKLEVGKVKIVRTYATDSEAEILENKLGIRPEDVGRPLYSPPVVYAANLTERPNERSRPVNFSAIGRTLAVIGLGVLIVSAARGGQTSVTDVIAQPNSDGDTPSVRVTWRDNLFGQANVQQYKIYRDPDFPFNVAFIGNNNNNNGGGNGGTTNLALVSPPVGTAPPNLHMFTDHAGPFFYPGGLAYLVGTSNGSNTGSLGNNNGGNGGNGGNNNNGGCGAIIFSTDYGFTPGKTYRYLVTAIILRQTNPASSTTGGTGGGTGGGGFGGGTGGTGGTGNGNNNSVVECIETDPAQASGFATPINPVLMANATPAINATVDIKNFNPNWPSRAGADVYQFEVSTDSKFSNPSRIYKIPVISTAPTANGVAQKLPQPVDLTLSSELLSDATFSNFVNQVPGTNPTAPTIYWRVGARHDSDNPGPVNWFDQNNPGSNDRTFRWIYPRSNAFMPAPLPPAAPGSRAAALLNRLRTSGRAAGTPLPLPGDTEASKATPKFHVPTLQEIRQGRTRI